MLIWILSKREDQRLIPISTILKFSAPYYITMRAQFTGHVIQTEITWPAYCNAIGWSSGDVIRTIYVVILSIIFIKNAKIKINNYNRSKPEIIWFLWDIVVFRLVLYLLNMICLYLQLLYKIAYEFSYKYDTVLYPFPETGTSNGCLICIVERLRYWVPLSKYFFLS